VDADVFTCRSLSIAISKPARPVGERTPEELDEERDVVVDKRSGTPTDATG
jgi:hypothetical protein